jgi:hypothetical protein
VERINLRKPYFMSVPKSASEFGGFSTLNFRQGLSSNLHFRQFNGSRTANHSKVGQANFSALIELAATNWLQRRQRISSSHTCRVVVLSFIFIIVVGSLAFCIIALSLEPLIAAPAT